MSERIMNINERTIQAFVNENRPPIEIRDQLDLGYSFKNNVIELYEIRPSWNKPDELQKLSFAKIKYVKSQAVWKLYWMRATGKWNSYQPFPESTNLEKILSIIDDDSYGCFRG